jgi:hypothetical protein
VPLTHTLSVLVYMSVTGLYTSTGQFACIQHFTCISCREVGGPSTQKLQLVFGVSGCPCTGTASQVPCVWTASVPAVYMQTTASNLDAQS